MKRMQIPEKLMYEKSYVYEIAAVNFIKNLLPEKRKENMQTKKARFKSRLN